MKLPLGGFYTSIIKSSSNFFCRQRMKNKRRRMEAISERRPAHLPQGSFAPRAVGRGFSNPVITNAHQEILVSRTQAFVRASDGAGNAQAAVALRAMLRSSVSNILT